MSQLAQATLGELVLCLSEWGFLPRMVHKLFICSLKHSTTVNRRHLSVVIEIGKMSLFHQRLGAVHSCKVGEKTLSGLRAQMNAWGQDINPCLLLICENFSYKFVSALPRAKHLSLSLIQKLWDNRPWTVACDIQLISPRVKHMVCPPTHQN